MMNSTTEGNKSQYIQKQNKRKYEFMSMPTEEEKEKKRPRESSPAEVLESGESNSILQSTTSQQKDEKDSIHLSSSPIRKDPLNILVVDDCALQQKILSRLLKNIGYTADIAGDGLRALEMIKTKLYDSQFTKNRLHKNK